MEIREEGYVSLLLIDPRDNVGVALAPLAAGDCVRVGGAKIVSLCAIPFGHKIALRDVPAGEPVVKYGEVIGRAKVFIARGSRVHVHNLESLRGRGDLA